MEKKIVPVASNIPTISVWIYTYRWKNTYSQKLTSMEIPSYDIYMKFTLLQVDRTLTVNLQVPLFSSFAFISHMFYYPLLLVLNIIVQNHRFPNSFFIHTRLLLSLYLSLPPTQNLREHHKEYESWRMVWEHLLVCWAHSSGCPTFRTMWSAQIEISGLKII